MPAPYFPPGGRCWRPMLSRPALSGVPTWALISSGLGDTCRVHDGPSYCHPRVCVRGWRELRDIEAVDPRQSICIDGRRRDVDSSDTGPILPEVAAPRAYGRRISAPAPPALGAAAQDSRPGRRFDRRQNDVYQYRKPMER